MSFRWHSCSPLLLAARRRLRSRASGRRRDDPATRTPPTRGGALRHVIADGSSTVGPLDRGRRGLPGEARRQRRGRHLRDRRRVRALLRRRDRPLQRLPPDQGRREAPLCAKKRIEYTEFQVAVDALTVVVNTENDWVDCLTVDQLEKIWEPGRGRSPGTRSTTFPDQELTLSGPGTDSGTFDYFTDEINGEEGASRADYTASEDDNTIVQAVSGTRAVWATSALLRRGEPGHAQGPRDRRRRRAASPRAPRPRRTAPTRRSPGRSSSTRRTTRSRRSSRSRPSWSSCSTTRARSPGGAVRAADRRAAQPVAHGARGRRHRRRQRMTAAVHQFFPRPSQHSMPNAGDGAATIAAT